MISACETDKLPQGYYRHSGTVLLRRDSSGNGQSLLLFLRDLGARWVFAPGAAGKKPRFGGAAEPLVWAEFHLYQSAGWLYLQNAEVKEDFLPVRTNRERLLTAMRFYKRIRQILLAEHESNQILTVLWNAMLALNEACPCGIVEFRFNWRLLRVLGLAPSLRTCAGCGSLLGGEPRWSRDGLLCARCGGADGASRSGALQELQKAALLDQRRFIEWSREQTACSCYKEQAKKLLIFFTGFD